jgi:hypothetical protein
MIASLSVDVGGGHGRERGHVNDILDGHVALDRRLSLWVVRRGPTAAAHPGRAVHPGPGAGPGRGAHLGRAVHPGPGAGPGPGAHLGRGADPGRAANPGRAAGPVEAIGRGRKADSDRQRRRPATRRARCARRRHGRASPPTAGRGTPNGRPGGRRRRRPSTRRQGSSTAAPPGTSTSTGERRGLVLPGRSSLTSPRRVVSPSASAPVQPPVQQLQGITQLAHGCSLGPSERRRERVPARRRCRTFEPPGRRRDQDRPTTHDPHPHQAVCATVSVVEAVREDRWQA